ncbi:MAG: hypothetical protein M3475_08405, partial [Actinomycetota bacterium]|nr:hypothetical protein [Actinomycetota bacterium]
MNNIDFVGRWRTWFAISGVLLLLGVLFILVRGMNFGIDFEGGAKFTVTSIEGSASIEEVQAALPEDLRESAVVQSLGDGGYEVRTPVINQAESRETRDGLKETLGAEVSVQNISPTFGGQVRNQALQAVAAALIVI